MPNTKKTPVAAGKKKTTASARARISTKKARRTTDNNGSYITEQTKKTVSKVSSSVPPMNSGPTQQGTASNDAILAYLAKIDESTQALTQRVNQIEKNQSMDMTPVRQGSHSHNNDAAESFCPQVASTSCPNRQSLRFQDSNLPTMQPGHSSQGANFQSTETLQNPNIQGNPPSSYTWQPQVVNHDNIIPSIDALRGNPTVSDTVAKVLASCDTQARTHVLQGKQPTLSTSRRSGRYNLTDICNVSPQYRWPNEGYQGSAGKIVYRMMTSPYLSGLWDSLATYIRLKTPP